MPAVTDSPGLDQLRAKVGGSAAPPAPTSRSAFTITPVSPDYTAFHISPQLAGLQIRWGTQQYTFERNISHADDDRWHGPAINRTVDESKTMLQSLKLWGQMSPEELAAFQAALYNHGFFGKGDKKWANFGTPDETSLAAWQRALTRAARYGKTIWEVLGAKDQADFISNAQNQFNTAVSAIGSASAGHGGGARRAPLQIRYSNPEDLKAVATKAAQETLGYVPDESFLDSFVKVYHGVEGSAQRKAYGGGNYTDPGDPTVLAQKKAREKYRNAATAHDVSNQYQQFLQIIGATG